MAPSVNDEPYKERTYIMVKVQLPCPPLHADLLTTIRLGHLVPSYCSPTASSEVWSATSSPASRNVDSNSSPSNSSMLPPHTSRSVSPVTVTHNKSRQTHASGFLSLFPFADYEVWQGTQYFPGLLKYMTSGPVVAMVWQGLAAVKTGRSMLGETDPLASSPGSLLPLNSDWPLEDARC